MCGASFFVRKAIRLCWPQTLNSVRTSVAYRWGEGIRFRDLQRWDAAGVSLARTHEIPC
jgi:hypothetical protein